MKKLRLNKKELIEAFIENSYISCNTELVGSNLKAFYLAGQNKRVLINYTTPIAIIDVNKNYNMLILNDEHYSQTTTVNQNLLKMYASFNNMDVKRVSEKEIFNLYWEK